MEKHQVSILNPIGTDLLRKPISKFLPENRRSKSSIDCTRLQSSKISLKPLNFKKTQPRANRRHMRLVRLFRQIKDFDTLYDENDKEMDDLMIEIDGIVRSCNFFSVRKNNHPVSLDLKLKLLTPVRKSNQRFQMKRLSKASSAATFKSKINESYCDLEEVSELSEVSSIQEPEDPEDIIYQQKELKSSKIKLPSLKLLQKENIQEQITKDSKSETSSSVNLRRDSANSMASRRSFSTNSIGSTGRKIYFKKRSLSCNRGLSPFKIVSSFNRNGFNKHNQFNRPNGFKRLDLNSSQESSLSLGLFDDYVSELEKIKSLKRSFPENNLRELESSESLYRGLPKLKEKIIPRPKPDTSLIMPKPKPSISINDPINVELKKWQTSLTRHRRAITTLNSLLNQASRVEL
ncbi:unnamed protein product [Blepharisma stoltei]|uniref:Uncharacterized protein n=1 Tax=Blepharisma stoltei TaxID=1481888 RepID=A0AAU9K4E8_9CILI|nr:unnamed protein product [Blepharisma stoltei]